MSRRVSGRRPLAYLGVESEAPPNLVVYKNYLVINYLVINYLGVN